MENQFLRQCRRKKDGLDKNIVNELIHKHQENFILLAKIDPNEIVIFQDKQGGLATSDVKISDLIRKDTKAKNNSTAVFQDVKLRTYVPYDTIVESINSKVKKIGDTMKGTLNMNNNLVSSVL